MQEIEVKILDIDVDSIIKKIEDLGGKKIMDEDIEGIIFNTGDGPLLRLRTENGKNRLTVKEKVSKEGAKIMTETEVDVDDYDTMVMICEKLGFPKRLEFMKHRLSYNLEDEGVHFDIDTYPKVPTFLEIEAPSVELIKKYVEILGYTMDDAKPWGAKETCAHYGIDYSKLKELK